MIALGAALNRLNSALDRNKSITDRVKPVQRTGDKTDMKDKGKNGDRRWDESDLEYRLRMKEKDIKA